MIKKFTVFGERCSGTNFLEQAILQNFNLEITWDYGWKHWIGHHQFQNTELEDETLFIGIIREPIGWIDSFFKKPHHLPEHLKKNIQSFIKNEFYSTHVHIKILDSLHQSQEQSLGYIEKKKGLDTEPI